MGKSSNHGGFSLISWEAHVFRGEIIYKWRALYFSINSRLMDFQPSQIPVDKHHGSQKKCDLEGYTTCSDTPMCFPWSTNWLRNMYHSSALAIFCFHHLCP